MFLFEKYSLTRELDVSAISREVATLLRQKSRILLRLKTSVVQVVELSSTRCRGIYFYYINL